MSEAFHDPAEVLGDELSQWLNEKVYRYQQANIPAAEGSLLDEAGDLLERVVGTKIEATPYDDSQSVVTYKLIHSSRFPEREPALMNRAKYITHHEPITGTITNLLEDGSFVLTPDDWVAADLCGDLIRLTPSADGLPHIDITVLELPPRTDSLTINDDQVAISGIHTATQNN